MVRRSTGFVTKKPHRKSRGGCGTCKRKKVKCDEAQPICRYCGVRNLECEYTQDFQSTSRTSSSGPSPDHEILSPIYNTEADFNDLSFQLIPLLVPPSQTSIGTFTHLDHQLLQYYKSGVWREFVVRDDAVLNRLHQDIVPQLGVSHPFLLYALLSIAANHSNELMPNKTVEKQALLYRQKTFSSYKEALRDITAENYEAVLVTGGLLLALVSPPSTDSDDEYLKWMLALLKLSEGLRILASLRWAQGMEKLSVYPLVRRELRTLPPPPIIDVAGVDAPIGPVGTTPDSPNPAPTYVATFPMQTRLFLPPPLMRLLGNIVRGKESGSIDWHRPTLLPVFHALSPIFLSLYYYHLNPDFCVRIFCFTSFLMPDFLQLVRQREPRALTLVAWWFALAGFVPKGWWVGGRGQKILGALGRAIRTQSSEDDGFAEGVFGGAQRIVDVLEREGSEAAAKSVFEAWAGVSWEEGPDRAQQWEFGLLMDLGDLNIDTDLDAMGLDVQELGISV